MGSLTYIVNHTKKQFFCPDACKFSEVIINDYIMRGILEILRCFWNNCQIEFITEYDIDKINPKEYEDISDKINWNDYRE